MTANIHSSTPELKVKDPRSQLVRSVGYCRTHPGEMPESRINRQVYDTIGHQRAGWDPRQWATAGAPNLTRVHTLSGEPLLSCSVDSGWKLRMPGIAHELRCEWDGRGIHRWIDYDNQLRPTALSERVGDEPPVTSERMAYGDNRTEFALRNQCARLIRQDDPAGCLHAGDYDLRGSRLSETRHFTSDMSLANWPERWVDRDEKLIAEGETTVWRFSAVGDLLSQTDARENQRLFAYGIAGQVLRIDMKRIGLPSTPLLTSRRYSATRQIEHETAGNGVETTRCLDAQDDRLLRLTSVRSSRVFQDLAYEYDPVGNINRIQDFVPVARYFKNQRTDAINQYRYDSLSQLIEASGRECIANPDELSTYKQTFSYDQAGNLLSLVHEGVRGYTRQMVTEPSSNRSLVKPETGEPDFIKSFDSNGNLLVLSPGAQAMHWDCRNRLSEVVQVSRPVVPDDDERYRYDSGGQRLRKVIHRKTKSASSTREVRYLPGLEIHYTGDDEVRYVMGVDSGDCNARVLHWHQTSPENAANDQIRYSLGDHLGSCTLELDENAAMISHEGYYAYGETAWWLARGETEASCKTHRFCGKERDATGLYYYGFRYYAPWLQRWINPDPAGDIDGFNRYRMVRNNPLRFRDSQGLSPVQPINDFERWLVNQGAVIRYRRADDLPEGLRDEFESDFSSAIDFTRDALRALGQEYLSEDTKDKLGIVFGKRSNEQYLKMAAEAAKEKLDTLLSAAMEDYISGDRFVFVSANPADPSSQAYTPVTNVNADKFIYIPPMMSSESATMRAAILLHELSHVHAGTLDFWYLFAATSRNAQQTAIDASVQADTEAPFRDPARVPDLSTLPNSLKAAKLELVKQAIAKYPDVERQHSAARITVFTHNADSLTALILQFRPQQTH